MFGAIAGGIASALAGGAMSKLFGGGQKAASGGIQVDVLATDNNTVGMGDAGIRFFFFSSRRRHTRCLSDWSSDVCSSDLDYRWQARTGGKAAARREPRQDRKSTRLNSSHLGISYAVFCLKKKKKKTKLIPYQKKKKNTKTYLTPV